MMDDRFTHGEAVELGARLEMLCRELSPRQQAFLQAALALVAANPWIAPSEQSEVAASSIRDLIVSIQQADDGAAEPISLNPQPIPADTKGPPA